MNARRFILITLIAFTTLLPSRTAEARVTLESICSIYGQKPMTLTGIGLVVGLNGTGDGEQAGPSIDALKQALDLLGQPVVGTIGASTNVAVVALEVRVPANAVRIGQQLDVRVSSMLSAESLKGGTLMPAPLISSDRRSRRVLATAKGPVDIEGEYKTTGRIFGGADIEANLFEEKQFLQNVFKDNVDAERGKTFTLQLNPQYASFSSTAAIADTINADFQDVDIYGRTAARALGPGFIEVTIPPQYKEDPISFVGEVLDLGIDRPHTQARVVINNRSKTVVVSGEASLSPVMISHPGLQIEVGPSFRQLADPQEVANNTQLKQLVAALGQLQVPTDDVISIIRELKASGKLHANLVEQ